LASWGREPHIEHPAGAIAPTSGYYRLLNVLGTPTDYSVHVKRGEPLPIAPRGNSWRLEREAEEDDGLQDRTRRMLTGR